MKVRDNTVKLLDYLRRHPHPVSVRRLMADGVMDSRDASEALQYGILHGVIECIRRPGAVSGASYQYRVTGHPLPLVAKGVLTPSFDALLTAWGIARVPPVLPSHRRIRVEAAE